MLNIECTLSTGEMVVIDWHGASPVLDDLIGFLKNQYPHSAIQIYAE